MPERRISLCIRFTSTQLDALDDYADARGVKVSDLIRDLLHKHIPDFPLDNPPRGNPKMQKGAPSVNPEHQKNLRRKKNP